MKQKFFISFILILFLTACGQTADEIGGTTKEALQEETTESLVEEENTQAEESIEARTNNLSSELEVHYIDVGQADATLFQYSDDSEEYTILYDTGDWKSNNVVNYLESQKVSSIDLIVVSHPDADHIGQLADIVTTFDVGEVWLSGNESSSETFQEAIEAIIESDADYHEPRTGEQFEIGPMEIEVVYPKTITGKSNEESLSLLFTYGNVRFLHTGDAGREEELEMLNTGIDLQADILQLGHHGSDTSSDPAFIKAVQPDVAIYSAGEDNSYGHPSPEIVSLIQENGIALYGTDVHGTIIVTTDGINYTIKTKENGTISPETTNKVETASKTEETKLAENEGVCVNINEASKEELQQIKHIGPERAQALIELRPFSSVDDLRRIDGIGPARLADIKEEGLACVK